MIFLAAVLVFAAGAAVGQEKPDAETEKLAVSLRDQLSKLAATAETMTVVGRDGWLFPANELRHVSVGRFWSDAAQKVSRARIPSRRDPLAAIVAYNKACKQAGIKLILLPVPAKSIVYPDKIADVDLPAEGPMPRLDTIHQEFYRVLRDKDVMVLDITADLLAARAKGQKVFCKTDAHWSPTACRIAAKRLAVHLAKTKWPDEPEPVQTASQDRKFEIVGDLVRTLPTGVQIGKEPLTGRFVGRAGAETFTPVPEDVSSPLLLLADSHGLVFHTGGDMHVKGAGLADQLVAELGFGVDLIAARGSAATPVRVNLYRKAARNPDWLAGKKVIVWCFTVRELTESAGWAEVPVRRN
jgi:alginate O-acetyltransferase complex protein AlgJ